MKARFLTGLLIFSIGLQQLVFFTLCYMRVKLVNISEWVLPVPIMIIWGLYLLSPLLFVRPLSRKEVFRGYAVSGWLFVLASVFWSERYSTLSERYGTPVSWERVKERYFLGDEVLFQRAMEKKKPNQASEPTSGLAPGRGSP